MIRKFATVPGFAIALTAMFWMILAGATAVSAQQTPDPQTTAPQTTAPQAPAPQTPAQPAPAQQQPPAAQAPDSSQSSSQEVSDEELPRRKVKPREYKNWSFNVGGGGSLTDGTTATYVRGGGPIGAAGVARNYSKYFGFRLDFQWDDLPLRTSSLQLAQAPSATSHVYTFNLDPIINIPATKVWSGYIVFGPGFFHRSGSLESSGAVPGQACNGFWDWWGSCFNGHIPLNNHFLKANQNEFGYNLGAGIARKIRPNIELYGEVRYMHGKANNTTTDFRPITIGLRW